MSHNVKGIPLTKKVRSEEAKANQSKRVKNITTSASVPTLPVYNGIIMTEKHKRILGEQLLHSTVFCLIEA